MAAGSSGTGILTGGALVRYARLKSEESKSPLNSLPPAVAVRPEGATWQTKDNTSSFI